MSEKAQGEKAKEECDKKEFPEFQGFHGYGMRCSKMKKMMKFWNMFNMYGKEQPFMGPPQFGAESWHQPPFPSRNPPFPSPNHQRGIEVHHYIHFGPPPRKSFHPYFRPLSCFGPMGRPPFFGPMDRPPFFGPMGRPPFPGSMGRPPFFGQGPMGLPPCGPYGKLPFPCGPWNKGPYGSCQKESYNKEANECRCKELYGECPCKELYGECKCKEENMECRCKELYGECRCKELYGECPCKEPSAEGFYERQPFPLDMWGRTPRFGIWESFPMRPPFIGFGPGPCKGFAPCEKPSCCPKKFCNKKCDKKQEKEKKEETPETPDNK